MSQVTWVHLAARVCVRPLVSTVVTPNHITTVRLVAGLAAYRNATPYSLGRHLRDAHSAALMVNNDRILANTAQLGLALRDDPELLA